MYRTASRSRATQSQSRRSSDAGPKHARFLVVAFRRGRDNMGRERVYRRVWAESFYDQAESRMEALAESYEYRAVLHADGTTAKSYGTVSVAEEWAATRRGHNRGADWCTASTHADREGGHDRSAVEQRNDFLETCAALGRTGNRSRCRSV